MKKIFFNLLFFFLASIFAFSCDKNTDVKSDNFTTNQHININDKTNLQFLINKTGIDIFRIANLPSVQSFSKRTFNTHKEGSTLVNTKAEISDYQIAQLQSLNSAIQQAFNNGNERMGYILYDSLCALCHSIGGFVFQENEYGFETFMYSDIEAPVYIPMAFMKASKEDADQLYLEIKREYPSFDTLNDVVKQTIIAAAVYQNYCNISDSKETNPSDKERCLKEAQRTYAESLCVATATYQAALMGCGLSGPGLTPCIIIASSSYGVSVAVASWQYKRAVKRC